MCISFVLARFIHKTIPGWPLYLFHVRGKPLTLKGPGKFCLLKKKSEYAVYTQDSFQKTSKLVIQPQNLIDFAIFRKHVSVFLRPVAIKQWLYLGNVHIKAKGHGDLMCYLARFRSNKECLIVANYLNYLSHQPLPYCSNLPPPDFYHPKIPFFSFFSSFFFTTCFQILSGFIHYALVFMFSPYHLQKLFKSNVFMPIYNKKILFTKPIR